MQEKICNNYLIIIGPFNDGYRDNPFTEQSDSSRTVRTNQTDSSLNSQGD